ncbi:hypothetical protein Q7430_10735 [Glaesserella parasuis]|nr:hypothetical protein [Glaesserella parasuis]
MTDSELDALKLLAEKGVHVIENKNPRCNVGWLRRVSPVNDYNHELHSSEKSSFWQEMEYRKRCYAELERRDFAGNVDYDEIFNQIDKDLSDECSSKS